MARRSPPKYTHQWAAYRRPAKRQPRQLVEIRNVTANPDYASAEYRPGRSPTRRVLLPLSTPVAPNPAARHCLAFLRLQSEKLEAARILRRILRAEDARQPKSGRANALRGHPGGNRSRRAPFSAVTPSRRRRPVHMPARGGEGDWEINRQNSHPAPSPPTYQWHRRSVGRSGLPAIRRGVPQRAEWRGSRRKQPNAPAPQKPFLERPKARRAGLESHTFAEDRQAARPQIEGGAANPYRGTLSHRCGKLRPACLNLRHRCGSIAEDEAGCGG